MKTVHQLSADKLTTDVAAYLAAGGKILPAPVYTLGEKIQHVQNRRDISINAKVTMIKKIRDGGVA